MHAIPDIPTPLVGVRVQARRDPSVPDAVLVGQPPSPANGQLILGPGADALDVDAQWLVRYRVTAKAGSVQIVPLATGQPDHGWLVGTGQGTAAHWRAAGAALARAGSERARSGAVQVHLPPGTTALQAASLALGCVVGSHRYRVTGSAGGSRIAGSAGGGRIAGSAGGGRIAGSAGGGPSMTTVALIAPPGDGAGPLVEAVAKARVLGRATGLARDLANTPSGDKDPVWLAGTAARLAGTVPGLRATVRDEHWLAEHGFGGVLAVGGGSARPPRLLELAWDPPGGSPIAEHLVLVGKGVTFDTGGISIKPADGMHLMRTDMSGGAAVIATLLAVGQLRLPLRVTGLVPCAENHVSGAAYRPGDVVRQVNGTTTEVTNTDAEGRLVLADALAHAVRTLAPSTLVDVATLTGAMKVSLGLRTGGLFATERELAERIQAAGEAAGEPWWHMPLIDDHAEALRSDIADLRQCPPGPGGVTAAMFLREFTGGLPWAHLDIAGPARAEKDYDEVNAGGTGFATRTLIELACSLTG